MTDQEINIAIAEACGWTRIGDPYTASDGSAVQVWRSSDGFCDNYSVPSYTTDLNVIRSAILTQPIEIQWAIFTQLAAIVSAETPSYLGAAAQWAEAFLRTIGKWREG